MCAFISLFSKWCWKYFRNSALSSWPCFAGRLGIAVAQNVPVCWCNPSSSEEAQNVGVPESHSANKGDGVRQYASETARVCDCSPSQQTSLFNAFEVCVEQSTCAYVYCVKNTLKR